MRRFALAACALVGCASSPSRAPHIPITVVVRGDASEVASAHAALSAAPPLHVEVRSVELAAPLTPTAGPSGVEAALEKVRAAYDEPSWQRCMAPIDDPALVPALFAANRRDAASRVLFWRAACLLLKGDEAGARSVARAFASRELEIPNEKSDPAVPRLLNEAALEASRETTSIVRVVSAVDELVVSFDGRAAVCSTPCPIPARAGAHTLHAEGDGRSPEDREVSVDAHASAPIEVRFDPPIATPDLAARQWVTRWSSSPSIDAAPSLHLLAAATRARNVVLVVAQGGAHPSLRAALAVDGVVRARAEKEGARGDFTPSLVRELLVSGHVVERPSLLQRPLFWIAVVVAAGVAAGLTYYLTTLPHTATVRPGAP